MDNRHILYDFVEETKTRYVSFLGESGRFDLALTTTANFYGKKLVLDLQSNRFAIVGPDDLEEPGYLESAFALQAERADELRQFLYTVI